MPASAHAHTRTCAQARAGMQRLCLSTHRRTMVQLCHPARQCFASTMSPTTKPAGRARANARSGQGAGSGGRHHTRGHDRAATCGVRGLPCPDEHGLRTRPSNASAWRGFRVRSHVPDSFLSRSISSNDVTRPGCPGDRDARCATTAVDICALRAAACLDKPGGICDGQVARGKARNLVRVRKKKKQRKRHDHPPDHGPPKASPQRRTAGAPIVCGMGGARVWRGEVWAQQ